MKYIRNYPNFVESIKFDLSIVSIDMNESLSMVMDSILSSIGAEEVDIYDTLKLPKDDNVDKLDIENLSNNIEFVNSLSNIGLKQSSVQNSDDFETFINKPCRFMFIYNVKSNELENPDYLLMQSWDNALNKWGGSKLYKVNGDVKRFYDKLSSKTIEVDDDGKKYIYQTSNKNEYILQNTDLENDTFKKYLRTEDFEELIKDKKVKISVI